MFKDIRRGKAPTRNVTSVDIPATEQDKARWMVRKETFFRLDDDTQTRLGESFGTARRAGLTPDEIFNASEEGR